MHVEMIGLYAALFVCGYAAYLIISDIRGGKK